MQALDLSALRLAGLHAAAESVLLLSVAVRLYPFLLISGWFIRHESHKALLMVRPVKRAVVTRAPHLCHVSQSGDLASTGATDRRGTRSTLSRVAVAHATSYIDRAANASRWLREVELVTCICFPFDDVACVAIPRGLEWSAANRVSERLHVGPVTTGPVGQ